MRLKIEYVSLTQERVLEFSEVYNTAGTYTLTITGEISKTITITVKKYSKLFIKLLFSIIFFF
jgi:hypothetical protein